MTVEHVITCLLKYGLHSEFIQFRSCPQCVHLCNQSFELNVNLLGSIRLTDAGLHVSLLLSVKLQPGGFYLKSVYKE